MRLGTSSVVVAAFVGPGTVLTCATAGVTFGYALAWVVLFGTLAVFVLQSFTAGTGILARKGLGEAVRDLADTPGKRVWMFGIVILGLGIGCAAFESGNLAGAAAGIRVVIGSEGDAPWMVVAVAVLATLLLLLDIKQLIQVLAVGVAIMGVLFLVSVALSPVAWLTAVQGLFVPSIPAQSTVTIIALIGTTIVTYSLFLHPGACKLYWADEEPQKAWRQELYGMALFIPVGGIVSLSILFAGASLYGDGHVLNTIADFAVLLEPVAGAAARYVFGFGLFAAGLTSAITAPLAAAIGISELLGWDQTRQSRAFRSLWGIVVLSGLFFNLTGLSPLNIIIAAQAANGVLLPLIAGFVLYLTTKQQTVSLPAWYRGVGIVIVGVCGVLGVRTLWWVWTQLAA